MWQVERGIRDQDHRSGPPTTVNGHRSRRWASPDPFPDRAASLLPASWQLPGPDLHLESGWAAGACLVLVSLTADCLYWWSGVASACPGVADPALHWRRGPALVDLSPVGVLQAPPGRCDPIGACGPPGLPVQVLSAVLAGAVLLLCRVVVPSCCRPEGAPMPRTFQRHPNPGVVVTAGVDTHADVQWR